MKSIRSLSVHKAVVRPQSECFRNACKKGTFKVRALVPSNYCDER